ncbi:hypothetical protein, conserved [Leishmania tarentolae]|uniref:Peptidase M24 domain-containing protein n=1 Tax=Leishmania tarentolae TaxID=5689 RepID=A0A640KC97_LEITA|nr:hypothetical protein, conserved [Leishmania tarentolae]
MHLSPPQKKEDTTLSYVPVQAVDSPVCVCVCVCDCVGCSLAGSYELTWKSFSTRWNRAPLLSCSPFVFCMSCPLPVRSHNDQQNTHDMSVCPRRPLSYSSRRFLPFSSLPKRAHTHLQRLLTHTRTHIHTQSCTSGAFSTPIALYRHTEVHTEKMGRGYSASRSKSGRPTLRMKRSRSMSLHALKKNMDAHAAAKAANGGSLGASSSSAAETEVPRKALKVVRQRRTPSSSLSSSTATVSATPTAAKATMTAAATKVKSTGDHGRTTTTSASPRSKSAAFRRNLKDLEKQFDDAMEASEDEEETVMNTTTMTKYKECGRVVDVVLDQLSAACVPGANTKVLCDTGDEEVALRLKALFVKTKGADGKRLTRGISYPTNVSVNEMLCNDSPFRMEDGNILKEGDVVKLHVGCHLDGYPVSAARTVIVTTRAASAATEGDEEEAQRKRSSTTVTLPSRSAVGNTIEAARVALLTMMHALRPGVLNADITDLIAAVGQHYGVQAVEGVLSNRSKRWVPDGIDCIIARRVTSEDPHQDVADCEVGEHQVWCLDVAFTNNHNYRITLAEKPVTLFRRTPADFDADARVRQANAMLQEITDTHFCFPFHFKSLSNPLKGKLGIHVLEKKGVVDKLPPLRTKHGHVTARFSATVAVTAKRVTVLCGAPPTTPVATPPTMRSTVSEDTLGAEVLAVLRRPYEFSDARARVTAKSASDKSSPATKRMRVEAVENEE